MCAFYIILIQHKLYPKAQLEEHFQSCFRRMQESNDGHSRCEGIVVLGSEVVRVQIEHSHHESHENGYENHQELKDVFNCSTQRDLQGPEALVGRQDVRDARETQNDCDGVQAFRDELRVGGHPVDPS